MTKKIFNFIKENKFVTMLACVMVMFVISVGGIVYYAHNQEIQREIEFKQQQQQIDDLMRQMEYTEAELKVINNEMRYQHQILEKTSGRLIKEHVISDAQVSRGIRDNYSVDTFIVKSNTNVTAYELNCALQGTNLAGLGEAFVRAELKTGVNALFLTGLAITESGWGDSYLAQDRNNLFGFGAYDSSPSSAMAFDTKEDCIMIVAQFLADNYCSEGGRYYRGGTISALNYYYASADQWGQRIFNTICLLEKKCSNC